jgi:hypothetical protein
MKQLNHFALWPSSLMVPSASNGFKELLFQAGTIHPMMAQ